MTTLDLRETTAIQRQKMSYEEYLRFAPDSQIVEWVDGETIIHIPPIYEHQNIVSFFDNLLRPFVSHFDLGVIIPAPFEIKLWPGGPSREPDLCFIANAHLSNLTPNRYVGGPDLIIEVVSQGSVSEDRVYKFREYEQAGVSEYWLLDRRPRQQQVDCYVLGEDATYYPKPVDEDGYYRSQVLPGFWFSPEWLWQNRLSDTRLIFAQIMLALTDLPDDLRHLYQATYDLLRQTPTISIFLHNTK